LQKNYNKNFLQSKKILLINKSINQITDITSFSKTFYLIGESIMPLLFIAKIKTLSSNLYCKNLNRVTGRAKICVLLHFSESSICESFYVLASHPHSDFKAIFSSAATENNFVGSSQPQFPRILRRETFGLLYNPL